MRHSSWEDNSGDSLNDCRVRNYEEFGDAGNGTYGQRPREKESKKDIKKIKKLLKSILKRNKKDQL